MLEVKLNVGREAHTHLGCSDGWQQVQLVFGAAVAVMAQPACSQGVLQEVGQQDAIPTAPMLAG